MDQLKKAKPLLIIGEELEGCWHATALWCPEHVLVDPRVDDDQLRLMKTGPDARVGGCHLLGDKAGADEEDPLDVVGQGWEPAASGRRGSAETEPQRPVVAGAMAALLDLGQGKGERVEVVDGAGEG